MNNTTPNDPTAPNNEPNSQHEAVFKFDRHAAELLAQEACDAITQGIETTEAIAPLARVLDGFDVATPNVASRSLQLEPCPKYDWCVAFHDELNGVDEHATADTNGKGIGQLRASYGISSDSNVFLDITDSLEWTVTALESPAFFTRLIANINAIQQGFTEFTKQNQTLTRATGQRNPEYDRRALADHADGSPETPTQTGVRVTHDNTHANLSPEQAREAATALLAYANDHTQSSEVTR